MRCSITWKPHLRQIFSCSMVSQILPCGKRHALDETWFSPPLTALTRTTVGAQKAYTFFPSFLHFFTLGFWTCNRRWKASRTEDIFGFCWSQWERHSSEWVSLCGRQKVTWPLLYLQYTYHTSERHQGQEGGLEDNWGLESQKGH